MIYINATSYSVPLGVPLERHIICFNVTSYERRAKKQLDTLIKYCPDWQWALHGDKTHTAIFDNTKIKKVVGDFTCKITLDEFMVRRAILYLDSGRVDQAIDNKQEALFDRIIREQNALGR